MSPEDDTPKQSSRRRFLRTTAATLTATATGATAATTATATATVGSSGSGATRSDYDTVIDVAEAGADPTGEESITPVLDRLCNDGATDTLLRFPPGTYAMDEMFRLVS